MSKIDELRDRILENGPVEVLTNALSNVDKSSVELQESRSEVQTEK